jgi:PAS domain S-box-containing protein
MSPLGPFTSSSRKPPLRGARLSLVPRWTNRPDSFSSVVIAIRSGTLTTEMEHATDDLAARHFAKIVDSSDDPIVSKDLKGIILSWNAAAERMFGCTAAEAIGRSIRIITQEVRQSEEDFVLSQIRAGKSVRHYETVRQRKDGSLIPISLTVSPIHNDEGVVIGASKIARDVMALIRSRGQIN